MTLANKITLLRILLIPVFLIMLLQKIDLWPLGLFLFLVFTDVLDGLVARWKNQKTALGTFFDPAADKLLLDSTFLILAHMNKVSMWVFVIIFGRDLLIFVGWNMLYILTHNATVSSRLLGKMATSTQMLTVVFLLSIPAWPLTYFALWIMITFTAASTIDYVWLGGKRLNDSS